MRTILLIISGSIAAYKSLELIRRLRERNLRVRCILTEGGAQFITPLSVASLSGEPVYGDLFSLKDETEMGHIRLSREANLVLVAPASADIIAKMAAGMTNDLATATLLATSAPVMIAPAMNVQMWQHPATVRNIVQLEQDGIRVIAPQPGMLACGEVGDGRMADVEAIVTAACDFFTTHTPLAGKTALITSGPTYEAIDPVRFIGNRSSGKQGHALAAALRNAGARVTLVTGPVALADPEGVSVQHVTSAEDMLRTCENALPADIAICAAAVSDWAAHTIADQKLKKRHNATPPTLALRETPDILHRLATHPTARPALVIGFAAETHEMDRHARDKLAAKHCDWILANNVAGGAIFGAEDTQITLYRQSDAQAQAWPRMSKEAAARTIVDAVVQFFAHGNARAASSNITPFSSPSSKRKNLP